MPSTITARASGGTRLVEISEVTARNQPTEVGLAQPDGYVYEEIGECLLLQNKKTESKSYFQKAYELLPKDKWLVVNDINDRRER